MWTGTLVAIYRAPEAGAPMHPVEAVRAVAGRGLEGDRYFYDQGSFSRWPGPHREVTLIAEEALAEMAEATGVVLAPQASRRNLLTRDVPLNDLVGRPFTIGTVHLEGIRLCEPCKYLVRLTGEPGLLPALVHRGGLRARILEGGLLQAGAVIRPVNTGKPAPYLPG